MVRSAARILDEYLVAAARTGDRKSFEMLAERWHGKLVAHAWRLTGDRDAAQDAAQSGWIEVARGLHRLQDERAFTAWAFRIVSRRCAKQVRDAIRRRTLAHELHDQPVSDVPQAHELLDQQRLRFAIAGLPRDARRKLRSILEGDV